MGDIFKTSRSGNWAISRISVLLLVAVAGHARAVEVRLWPSAVVTGPSVLLNDIGVISNESGTPEGKLGSVYVTASPEPGGSRLLHLEAIRAALVESGANMATLTISGATQCAVSRPAIDVIQEDPGKAQSVQKLPGAPGPSQSLRDAVIDHFNDSLRRYNGSAEIVFDPSNDQILALSGPTYSFAVRSKKAAPLGLLPIVVDVIADGQLVQSVDMAVRVTMIRPTVLARRSINQNATIGAGDLDFVPMAFTRVEGLGLTDTAEAVGQRAKRYIAAGMIVDATMLEQVPLVQRGQLVTVTSRVNGISVVTTGKANDSGLLGEIIQVRGTDDRRIAYDGRVVGPASVEVGRFAGAQLSTVEVRQ